jgi:hypothetical protein
VAAQQVMPKAFVIVLRVLVPFKIEACKKKYGGLQTKIEADPEYKAEFFKELKAQQLASTCSIWIDIYVD